MINLNQVSCVLITKDPIYPKQVLDHISQFPFGEILILTHCPNSAGKEELFLKAKYDTIYYQDDDAICPINELIEQYEPDKIICAMKALHLKNYAPLRIALFGWGSFIPKKAVEQMKIYTDIYGKDDLYLREYDRILTFFNFPQKRIELPIYDLPSAFAPDRYSLQKQHYISLSDVNDRCLTILKDMV